MALSELTFWGLFQIIVTCPLNRDQGSHSLIQPTHAILGHLNPFRFLSFQRIGIFSPVYLAFS